MAKLILDFTNVFSITPKQKHLISIISETLGIEFKGESRQDASDYISKYLNEALYEYSLNRIEEDSYWEK